MTIKKYKEVIQPKLDAQTLYQLTQIKTFIDNRLKLAFSQNFKNEGEATQYLLSVLYDIRDFVFSQTTENSVRINLINEFNEIEKKIKMGNDQQNLEKELSTKIEEKLEPDLENLEINEETEIESITNS